MDPDQLGPRPVPLGPRPVPSGPRPAPPGPRPVRVSFDGTALAAPRGLTIGGALVANGILSWSRTEVGGRPRGIFCGTGDCFDCLVDVGDRRAVRACLTPGGDGAEVRTSRARRA